MKSQPPAKTSCERKVEEVKQDADVQRALKQATSAEKSKRPVARTRDKFFIGTHLLLLVALGAVYQLLKYRFPRFVRTISAGSQADSGYRASSSFA